MGYFTFTDAVEKSPQRRHGEYTKKDKISYGGYIRVVCPDGTIYEDVCYDGYGRIGRYDVYNLVVDWNKYNLSTILKARGDHVFYNELKEIIEKYIESDYDEICTTEFVKGLVADGKCGEYLISDWKRNIGIMLACEDKDNEALPFPLKVTKSREAVDYDKLFPSRSTQ